MQVSGGDLFHPLAQLLCGIGDVVIKAMQKVFIGDGDIKSGGIDEAETSTFHIRYSPLIIFSNTLPSLDINFIEPMPARQAEAAVREWETTGVDYDITDTTDLDTLSNNYGFNINTTSYHEVTSDDEWYNILQAPQISFIYEWSYNDKNYALVNTTVDLGSISGWDTGLIDQFDQLIDLIRDGIQGQSCWELYQQNQNVQLLTNPDGTPQMISSSANVLKDTIASWYKALRAFALVGLLSVLVYIGIRIILSSTAQESSKYKKMVTDWLVAICILFILQYIMIFTLTITQKLTDVFLSNSNIAQNGEDTLMSDLRNKIGEDPDDFYEIFGETIFYLALVIYSVIFTIHYLKRLIYMAFFTMIAPLIALTYPIDKVKDGQAQAFSMWLREYIFNALIQPVHLLLYLMFIGSAASLIQENPLYAIVALAFLIPAEKFFRKMFGFEKSSSVGQLGAAAGGAMVMNAINKMQQKSSQAKGAGGGAQKPVRTSGNSGR